MMYSYPRILDKSRDILDNSRDILDESRDILDKSRDILDKSTFRETYTKLSSVKNEWLRERQREQKNIRK